ncbi:hypothetical protein [Mesorhizobium helmanticense]|uniref:Uncharacterized protein n=1 Tax=Mesorhizobium helmanticense TaxID=1776423 RepID=A0A2T4J286_9HYPH|nr:hypothetical protein [Mesorhizobium helmanticense]PTE12016.1 hypothetical protein C9427_02945 [Mesorhizobium helmanticense]
MDQLAELGNSPPEALATTEWLVFATHILSRVATREMNHFAGASAGEGNRKPHFDNHTAAGAPAFAQIESRFAG